MINLEPNTLDAPLLTEHDQGFVGVNMRIAPDKLSAGLCAYAENMRFTKSTAETRKGYLTLKWTNQNQSDQVIPWQVVYGSVSFRDPNGGEWQIVAADGQVYRVRDSNFASKISLPDGVTVDYPVNFTAAFNILIMWRGDNGEPLVMENIDVGWEIASHRYHGSALEMYAPNTRQIPNGVRGLAFQNRVITWVDDLLYVSDIQDYTRYAPATGAYRINQGDSGELVQVVKYSEQALVCLKTKAVYLLGNLYPDSDGNFSMATLDEITHEFGCAAPDSVVRVGNDIWWLSEKGIVSLNQTVQGKVQAQEIPKSDEIQPVIQRINWRFASGAVAAYTDNKSYFAVPVDTGQVRRANLVSTSDVYLNGIKTYAVMPGKTYEYTAGDNETALVNGTETLTPDSGTTVRVVAQQNSITLQSLPGAAEVFSESWDAENGATAQYNYTGFANWDITDGDVDLCGGTLGSPGDAEFFDPPSGAGMYIADRFPFTVRTKNSYLFADGVTYRLTIRLGAYPDDDDGTVRCVIPGLLDHTFTVPGGESGERFDTNTYYVDFTPSGGDVTDKLSLTTTAPRYWTPLIDQITLTNLAEFGDDDTVTASVIPVYLGIPTATIGGEGTDLELAEYSGINNLLLVYDHLNGQWSGIDLVYDESGNNVTMIQKLFTANYAGRRRLFAIWADGSIKVIEEGYEDYIFDDTGALNRVWVRPKLITRGYAMGSDVEKKFLHATLNLKTWNPRYTISAAVDGVKEQKILVSDRTQSRTAYYRPPWKTAYDPTNVNDDFFEPYRKEYSVDLGPSAGIWCLTQGFDPNTHQETVEPNRIGRRGQYVQITLSGNQGRVNLKSLHVQATSGQQSLTPKH